MRGLGKMILLNLENKFGHVVIFLWEILKMIVLMDMAHFIIVL